MQTSDSDHNVDIDDDENDSMDWKILHDIIITSEDSALSNADGFEWINEIFVEENHTISNLEYAKLKLLNSEVNILSTEPITTLFDTELHVHVYHNKYLWKCQENQHDQENFKSKYCKQSYIRMNRNCSTRTVYGWIKILHIILLYAPNWSNIQFAQRCRIGLDWDMYWKLFLQYEGKKIATSMKTNNTEQWTIPS